ncbi:hypothetical protein GGF37_003485 [Kickxella alabastrina]|nr:hypothetical protein GGF37_003485 [Kickxella alabastrina]
MLRPVLLLQRRPIPPLFALRALKPKATSTAPALGHAQLLSQQRHYSSRTPFGRPSPFRWIRPLAYTAGGIALVAVGWPVLRYVFAGGLAYGAMRLVRLWVLVRKLDKTIGAAQASFPGGSGALGGQSPLGALLKNMLALFGGFPSMRGAGAAVSPLCVGSMRSVAETSFRASCVSDSKVAAMIHEALGYVGLADGFALGEPMDVQSSTVMMNGQSKSRLEAVFPVFVDGAATNLFVQALANVMTDAGAVDVDGVRVWARMASGEVAEASIGVVHEGEEDEGDDTDDRKRGRRKVQDAEYKDL